MATATERSMLRGLTKDAGLSALILPLVHTEELWEEKIEQYLSYVGLVSRKLVEETLIPYTQFVLFSSTYEVAQQLLVFCKERFPGSRYPQTGELAYYKELKKAEVATERHAGRRILQSELILGPELSVASRFGVHYVVDELHFEFKSVGFEFLGGEEP